MMRGERVSSREYVPVKPHVKHDEVSPFNRQIVEAIPFWPESTTTRRVARIVGSTHKVVLGHLSTIQDRFMIFGEGMVLSRLRDDLSNV